MEWLIIIAAIVIILCKVSKVFAPKTYIDENGYRRFSDSGYPVHRWVARNKLGRDLRDGEVVHHKNRNKNDNHESNLWVFKDQASHDRAHRYDAFRHGGEASYKGFKKPRHSDYNDDDE